jgi:hypothetical protein
MMEPTEAEVRQALSRLGKTAASGNHHQPHHSNRPRHRFVRDGEVPVVVLNRQLERRERTAGPATLSDQPAENRLEAAEAMLRQERTAREHSERALQEAQATIRDLETKLGHAVRARDEALEAVHAAEAPEQEAEARRAEERPRPVSGPAVTSDGPRRRGRPPGSTRKVVESGAPLAHEQTDQAKPATSSASSRSAAVRNKRAATRKAAKQKPVKWWREGWQAEFGF